MQGRDVPIQDVSCYHISELRSLTRWLDLFWAITARARAK